MQSSIRCSSCQYKFRYRYRDIHKGPSGVTFVHCLNCGGSLQVEAINYQVIAALVRSRHYQLSSNNEAEAIARVLREEVMRLRRICSCSTEPLDR